MRKVLKIFWFIYELLNQLFLTKLLRGNNEWNNKNYNLFKININIHTIMVLSKFYNKKYIVKKQIKYYISIIDI